MSIGFQLILVFLVLSGIVVETIANVHFNRSVEMEKMSDARFYAWMGATATFLVVVFAGFSAVYLHWLFVLGAVLYAAGFFYIDIWRISWLAKKNRKETK